MYCGKFHLNQATGGVTGSEDVASICRAGADSSRASAVNGLCAALQLAAAAPAEYTSLCEATRPCSEPGGATIFAAWQS